jgi:hypothetical protein
MLVKTKIVFQENEEIKMYDLSLFLKYFNILYLRAKEDNSQIASGNYNVNNFVFEKDNKNYHYYEQKLRKTDNDLVVYELNKHSPLELLINIDQNMVIIIFAIIKLNVSVNINVNIDINLNSVIQKMEDFFGNDI